MYQKAGPVWPVWVALLLVVCARSTLAFGIHQQYSIGENIGSAVAIADDGTRYVGGADKKLHAITSTGTRWSVATEGMIGATPLIAPDKTIYITSFDGHLYAINPSTRTIAWRFWAGGEIYASPAMGLDGTVYVGTRQGTFYAIDPSTRLERWRTYLGAEVGSSAAIGTDGTVWVGVGDGTLYGLDPDTGSVRHQFATAGGVSSPAVDYAGNIYVGSFDRKLRIFDRSGTLVWTYDAGGKITGSPVIGGDGTIVFVGYDNRRVVVVSADRSTVIRYTVPGTSQIYASPAIGRDGSIYIATNDGKLHRLKKGTTSLTIDWTFSGDGGFLASPTLDIDGRITITSMLGTFYSINNVIAMGVEPQWPLFGRDAKHSRAHPDSDRDACPNAIDTQPANPSICVDVDGDGLDDSVDQDMDNDGIPDSWELANGLNPRFAGDGTQDPDRDGLNNQQEYLRGSNPHLADSDGDGVPDPLDEMPLDPKESADNDRDGIGDNADPDDDNDGMSDEWERRFGFDPKVADSRTRDLDGDGLTDWEEAQIGSDPRKKDSDGDGMPDAWEFAFGLDLMRNDANEDPDNDRYSNMMEYLAGTDPHLNEFDDVMPSILASKPLADLQQVIVHNSDKFIYAITRKGIRLLSGIPEDNLAEKGYWSYGAYTSDFLTQEISYTKLSAAISPDGQYLLVLGQFDALNVRELRNYQIGVDGSLTLVHTVPITKHVSGQVLTNSQPVMGGLFGVDNLVLSADGKQLYASTSPTGILIFDRNPSTGALTFRTHFLAGQTQLVGGQGLVLSKDGQYLFMRNGGKALSVFKRSATGELSAHALLDPGSVAGKDRYALAAGTSGETVFSIMRPDTWNHNVQLQRVDSGARVTQSLSTTIEGSQFIVANPKLKMLYVIASSGLYMFSERHEVPSFSGSLMRVSDTRLAGMSSGAVNASGNRLYIVANNQLLVLSPGNSGLGRSDRDGDGYDDRIDRFPDDPTEWFDTDGDGIGNNRDDDDDGDGYPDVEDAFPLDPEQHRKKGYEPPLNPVRLMPSWSGWRSALPLPASPK